MARLDTHWHANPKVLALGLPAMGLHAWSISYCDAELTDGFVPFGAVPRLEGIKTAIERLIRSGCWEVVDGGYRLHDYLDYNRSRDQALAARAASAERMQRTRSRRNNGGGYTATNGATSGEVAPSVTPVLRPLPVPGLTTLAVSQSVRPESPATPAGAREDGLPDEVLERLNRPPIGALTNGPTNGQSS
jgi:hypothetical protein